MRIPELYKKNGPVFSFEFFPPKTQEAEEKLFEVAHELKALRPGFISVTYGAMGTTRTNTLRIVSRFKKEVGLEAAAHLTCIAHNRAEIDAVLQDLTNAGIENIVALRGDVPQDPTSVKELDRDFRYALELVQHIRKHSQFSKSFSLIVAGYPETHVECRDKKKDLEHLKRKVDAGADAIITQLFFNNTDYFDFVERARKEGINIPIIPGIMPVTNGSQIKRFADMCGASIPEKIRTSIEKLGDDLTAIESYGIEYASQQCQELLEKGVPGIHFYTLNKSRATREIVRNLQQKFSSKGTRP